MIIVLNFTAIFHKYKTPASKRITGVYIKLLKNLLKTHDAPRRKPMT